MAVTEDHEPESKRRKLSKDERSTRPLSNIDSAKGLKEILVFEQDVNVARQNVQRFKSFLFELKQDEQTDLTILKKEALAGLFLSSETRISGERIDVLSGVIQTWHFAARLENDVICSSVPATISLLLKYLSTDIRFRECGGQICETMLHEDNLKLFDRNLSSQRSKEHLIEPCIRLLTEIVQFDGGSFAKLVHRRRFTTFQRLETFLATKKSFEKSSDRDRRHVSIREISVRYLLANLRLQDQKGKEFLLNQTRLSRALLQYLPDDPPWLSEETFEVLEEDVLRDLKIDRSVQRRFFNSASLLDLARLYDSDDIAATTSGHTSLRDKAHSILSTICNSSTYGLLHIDRDRNQPDVLDSSELPTSVANDDASSSRLRKKTALASIRTRFIDFFQRLRPHADILQAELIIQAFRLLPELMVEYFQHKSNFTLDPKLTITWLGYSRFILACIQNKIPQRFIMDFKTGKESDMEILDCILPEPCTRKVLTKCLNQTNNIITFMAVNIMNAAFAKLQHLSIILRQQNRDHAATQVINVLKVGFSERCPDIRHVVGQYYATSEEHYAYRQSIARLLANYFHQLPGIALEAKFDTSNDLFNVLASTNDNALDQGCKKLRALEADDLIQISKLSPNVQWFQKADGPKSSLFTALLKYIGTLPHSEWRSWALIGSQIAAEHRIFQPASCMRKLVVLIQTLADTPSDEQGDIYDFLDICFTKLVRAPVKYHDRLLGLTDGGGSALVVTSTDLLFVSIWDQWVHVNQNKPEAAFSGLASWLGRIFRLFSQHVAKHSLVTEIYQQVILSTADEVRKNLVEGGFDNYFENTLSAEFFKALELDSQGHHIQRDESSSEILIKFKTDIPPPPSPESEDHPELHRWMNVDLQDAIMDGMIGELCFCLCSQTLAVRKEALAGLKSFQSKLEASQATLSDWQQEFLLTLELIETAKGVIPDAPLPYFTAAFAAQCISILMDPLHLMYVKINAFLQRAPSWNSSRLPKQWIKNVILSEPTEADKGSEEINWLLEVLLDGLRTIEDMQIYHTCHVFEYLQSLCNSPWTTSQAVRKTIDILFRCTHVGGSTILMTRFGTPSWIATSLNMYNGEHDRPLQDLRKRLEETCDHEAVEAWRSGKHKGQAIVNESR